jgi:CheY-like chemotaxis protein
MMGGRIWVESEVGKGSTFHFTARFGLPPEGVVYPVRVRSARLEGLPVLVVDDNATNRRILQDVLTNWRMRPTLVEGGRPALAALREAVQAGEPFPLVLLDGHMPEMDGFQLAEHIQAAPDLAGVTLLMLTSAGRPEDVERCRRLGIRAYLMKPVKQSELFDSILTALSVSSWEPMLPEETAPREPQRPLRVLLAEDNVINQKLVVALLEKRGHRVTVAATGREALRQLRIDGGAESAIRNPQSAIPYDLVLMDVQMPEMDGFEAMQRLRAWERRTGGHLPVVAMTAYAMKGDRELCLSRGADDYISKPIQPAEVYTVIARLTAAAAPPPARPAEPPSAGVVDEAEAMNRVGGDRNLLRTMIAMFFDECPKELPRLREALARGDALGVRRAAHTLKGMIGNFGRREAYTAADRLEAMGRGADLSAAAPVLAELEEALARLDPALKTLAAAP